MASKFSSALKLTDLDDFISPSQECVKPVPSARPSRTSGAAVGAATGRSIGGSATIRLGDDGAPVELMADGEVKQLKKAQVTLNDCLACSGCITSAESVLIGQQSVDEVYRALAQVKAAKADRCADGADTHGRPSAVVVSVSPQSRASLAAHCSLTAREAAAKLTAFFRRLGADRVLDTTVARDVSLVESCKEFVRRKMDADKAGDSSGGGGRQGRLPMLASACPGWVCYAEKAHGAYVLPYISTVKSPQQIMGSIVKDFIARQLGLSSPAGVYHVAVMPCYDKKLEASRPDFHDPASGARDVDCVITTGEVVQMLQTEGFASLADVPTTVLPPSAGVAEQPGDLVELSSLFVGEDVSSSSGAGRASALEPYVHAGGGSGGYLEHVFKHAAGELYGETVAAMNYQVKRNQDFQEVTLSVGGEVKLTFALAYGFRNIQNVVQKVKQGRCPYDFVEVMACPSGCLNGGGQIRASDNVADTASARELLQRVTRLYNDLPVADPWTNNVTKRLYNDWLGGEGSDKAQQILHTQYHAVEKTINALTLKW